MKKTAFLALMTLVFLITSAALALMQRVYDDAGLFTNEQSVQLQARIEELYDTYDVDLVIVTASDTQRKSTRDFADDFYDNGEFGTRDDHTGALLLIDMHERIPYISTTGYMIDLLNDSRIEAILDAQHNHLAQGNYAKAMSVALDKIEGYLQSGPVYGQYREAEDKIDPFSPTWLSLSVGLGLLIAWIASSLVKKSYTKPFMPAPYSYQSNTDLHLTLSNDTLIDSQTTRRHIPPPSSSGGGSGGRSSTHTSSSGTSHGGGGGRKF